MPTTRDVLLRKIQETKAELEELQTALRVFERLEVQEEAPAAEAPIHAIPRRRIRRKKGPTLAIRVQKAIKGPLKGQDFTIDDVQETLQKTGKGSNATHFRGRVAVQVRELANDGVLRVTRKGAGGKPNRYKLKEKATP